MRTCPNYWLSIAIQRRNDGAILLQWHLNSKQKIISLLLALLAYSTQNQQTQMCDYIFTPRGAKQNELFPVFGGPELQVRSRAVLDKQPTHSARSMEHSHRSILSPRCSLLICPNFKASLRHALQEEWIHGTGCGEKSTYSLSLLVGLQLGQTLIYSLVFVRLCSYVLLQSYNQRNCVNNSEIQHGTRQGKFYRQFTGCKG